MKKVFCFLLVSMLLAGSLIAPAGATSTDDYGLSLDAYILHPTASSAVKSDVAPFNSITSFDSTISYHSGIDYGVYLSSFVNMASNSYIVSLTFNITGDSDLISGKVYTDFGTSSQELYTLTYNSNGKRYEGSTKYGYIKIVPTVIEGVLSCHVLLTHNGYYPTGNLYIPIDFSSRDDEFTSIIGYTPTVLSVSDASNADIVEAINAMAESSGASSNDLVKAFNQVGSNITASQASSSNQITSAVNQVQASTQQVKQAVEVMEQNMSGNVSSGLQEYDKQEEEKLTQELDGNVQDIVDKLPLLDQKDNFENATTAVINAFSDSSMDCNFTFPAGVVTVGGTTYTFWEEQTVDLNSAINNQYVQMLLIGFRFLLAYGLVFYALEWINKIISLVLMEDTGTAAQEWRSEYRENVRARGYKRK